LLNVMLVVAGLAIYILALSRLGFSASTFLFVAFLLGVVEKERWFKACFIALLSTAGLYLIFRILLDVKLPKNMYGF